MRPIKVIHKNSSQKNTNQKKIQKMFHKNETQKTSAWRLEVMKQKRLKKASFLTLQIRITNEWNKECLGGGEVRGQNALFKIGAVHKLRHHILEGSGPYT